MADLVIVPAEVAFSSVESESKLTAEAGVAITRGQLIHITSAGLWELGDTGNQFLYVAMDSVSAGQMLDGCQVADLDLNDALDAVAFMTIIYSSATAGAMATDVSAGDEIGYVIPLTERGEVKKLLRLRAGELR